jgi:hypothetical protein
MDNTAPPSAPHEPKLKPKEMKALESEVIRLSGLGKWFVKIPETVRDG